MPRLSTHSFDISGSESPSARPAPNLVTSLFIVVAATLGAGCGADTPGRSTTPNPPASAAAPAVSAAATPPRAKSTFVNPGGMWLPGQLASHQDGLKAAGFQLDPKVLTDPTAAPLGAVVSLGGCSASFVSPDGLIVTNHHCVEGMLQFVGAKEKKNLGLLGYHAKTRADEKWVGPTSRVFVTQSFKDVTTELRAGLETLPDDLARYTKIEERTKALISTCEKGRPEIRCSVRSFFGGAQYLLIEQIEIRDVRLVYAPHERVGNFGGEIDNWRWPRHTGDFSFIRAYVGKDQKPADHADSNVPYQPPHHLRIAKNPLEAGDFVAVAGYPGRTNRLRSAKEVRQAVEWEYPWKINAYEKVIAALEALEKQQPKLEEKISPMVGYLGNGLTKTRGLAEGLRGGIAAEREKEDVALTNWIDADPERKKSFGDVMGKLATLVEDLEKTREEDRALSVFLSSSNLLGAAMTIVRMAEERDKPDAARDPEFQERTWKRLEQKLVRLSTSYDRAIDVTHLGVSLELLGNLPETDRPAFLTKIVGKKMDRAAIDKMLADTFKTKLEDEKTRLNLFRTAKKTELAKSTDPLIKLAVTLRPLIEAAENRSKKYEGAMILLRPRYFAALQQMRSTQLAPDANGTLRVTYGTVRGYRPKPEMPMYRPFTTISEMVAKVTDKEPFDAPAKFVEAVRAKKFGKYVSPSLQEVPVDFLSDVDTTGGNSGSPTLNAKGELVGLLFDGNYEALASDVVFLPDITRGIHVDFRYVQWILDVDGADNVLTEMGITPSIE